jgi:hypothetical protein
MPLALCHISGNARYKVFFEGTVTRFNNTSYQWGHFEEHAKLLNDSEDIGGVVTCPPTSRAKLVLWMVLCYLGEPGGYGRWGRNRSVFNSGEAMKPLPG